MNVKYFNYCDWNYNLKDEIIIRANAAFFPSTEKAAFDCVVQINENILFLGLQRI